MPERTRRDLIYNSVGVLSATLIAGCIGDGREDDGNNDTEQDTEAGSDTNSGQETPSTDDTNTDQGQDTQVSDDLESQGVKIIEHEMYIEEGEFSDELFVEGLVENASGERVDYIELWVRLFDEGGNQVHSPFDDITNLDDGDTWAFEVSTTQRVDEIEEYDFVLETHFY